ncbi:MAG: hypothetical protein K8L97_31735 [Anaerolineae bacterium]|nr:hypothetical protein [Anaerolineae bacterium]
MIGVGDGAVSNIIGNGFTVYYEPTICTTLDGETYALNGGGYLQPISQR